MKRITVTVWIIVFAASAHATFMVARSGMTLLRAWSSCGYLEVLKQLLGTLIHPFRLDRTV